jgi:cytidylate kinase
LKIRLKAQASPCVDFSPILNLTKQARMTTDGTSLQKEIEKDIIERDYRDMNRETSPLKQAEDAVLVDTSDLDIDGVVAAIRKIVEEKIPV